MTTALTVATEAATRLAELLPSARPLTIAACDPATVPTPDTVAVRAHFVVATSADLVLVAHDAIAEAMAGAGEGVSAAEVLRPALEAASDVIGGGQLGEVGDGVPASLFQSADAVVFDLIGEEGVAGWFAIALRTPAPPRAFRDVSSRLGRISTVQMTLAVEIGRATVSVQELLDAQPGTVIELDRAVGSEADVFLNGRMIAHGEIVVVDRRFAVRVTEVLDPQDET